jgi:hypothetical protein
MRNFHLAFILCIALVLTACAAQSSKSNAFLGSGGEGFSSASNLILQGDSSGAGGEEDASSDADREASKELSFRESPSSVLRPSAREKTDRESGEIVDPWEGYNRRIYKFNNSVDKYVIRPLAIGYDKVTPASVQTGVVNFFSGLRGKV